ncbi:hypothetical protein ACFLRW_02270 [Acidobacteriota bacterium]
MIDTQNFDSYLRKKYKHSLFCFALAFANIYINNTSLKKTLNEYDRLEFRRFNDRLVNLRNKISQTLDDYYIFKNPPESEEYAILFKLKEIWKDYFRYHEFLTRLDEEIKANELLLSDPLYRNKRGIEIYEDTKVALIFSSIMRGKSEIYAKSDNKNIGENKYTFLQHTNYNIDDVKKRFVEFTSNITENIVQKDPNWDYIFKLMNWFYKNTSIRSILQKREGTSIKDRIRKYTSTYLVNLLMFDFQYFISQNYFENVSAKNHIIVRWKNDIVHTIYPVFSIEFNKDFIEIGEIAEKKITYKKYMKSNSEFNLESSRPASIEKNEIPQELIFPNDQRITLGNFKLS